MNVYIRQAVAKDADAIAELLILSVKTLCIQDYTDEQIEVILDRQNPKSYLARIQNKAETIFVAQNETNKIVGFASLSKNGGQINDLFVHPDYIRQGIATLLIENLEQTARQKVSRLSVTSSLTGRSFYSACGFEYIKDSAIVDPKTKIKVPCVRMVKVFARSNYFYSNNAEGESTITLWQFIWLIGKILLGN